MTWFNSIHYAATTTVQLPFQSFLIRFPSATVRIESFRVVDVPQPGFVILSVRRQRQIQRKRQSATGFPKFPQIEVSLGLKKLLAVAIRSRGAGEVFGQKNHAQFVGSNKQLRLIFLQGAPSGFREVRRRRNEPV